MNRHISQLPAVLVVMAQMALPSRASTHVDVSRLARMLASESAGHHSDESVAHKISRLDLTERLTPSTLAHLAAHAPGPFTKDALQTLADLSVFLDPPPAELPQDPPPTPEEQKRILAEAGDYAARYIHDLPNFICATTTRRLDDDSFAPRDKADHWRRFVLRDTVVSQLSFNRGVESAVTQTVNGVPWDEHKPSEGMITGGEFGNMLTLVFLAASNANLTWLHWETFDGRRLAVFRYSVDLAHSRYTVVYDWIGPHNEQLSRSARVPFHGAIAIEPATGTILRLSWRADNIPLELLRRFVETVVEYRNVGIGGRPWTVPSRSITLSATKVTSKAGPKFGSSRWFHDTTSVTPSVSNMGEVYWLTSLNETRFDRYRKFESESRLLADAAPPNETPAATVVPPLPVAVETAPPAEASAPAAAPLPELPVTPPAQTAVNELPTTAPTPTPPVPPPPPAATITPSFHEEVNLIPIRVVVRDSQGRVVDGLHKDDFEVLDDGKRRAIASFEVERHSAPRERETTASPAPAGTAVTPERFVLFLFDDLDLDVSELMQARKAAGTVLRDTSDPAMRVALYSTSGRASLDFTADRERAIETLNRLAPAGAESSGCPPVSYDIANRIVNDNDQEALNMVTGEAIRQCHLDPKQPDMAHDYARTRAAGVLATQEAQTAVLLGALKSGVRKMAWMPGERTIVLVSPGFLAPRRMAELDDVVDRAARQRILINSLDARGAHVSAGFDASDPGGGTDPRHRNYETEAADALVQLSSGTGGAFFQNNNNLAAGFRQLAAMPEVTYLLAFAPDDLKADGRFHRLKVTVADRANLAVQSRRGYYAPTQATSPGEPVHGEIEAALLSRDETNDIPVLFDARVEGAHLVVTAHIDVHSVQLEKKDGANRASLSFWAALFDGDGNYVSGKHGNINVDSTDDQLSATLAAGVYTRAILDAKPGVYLLRVVVRDPDGRTFASSRTVDIPAP